MFVQLNRKVKAHGTDFSDDLGQIYKIMIWNDKIVTLALDCCLKIWDHDLNLITVHPLFQYYMLSLACYNDLLFVGNGNGQVNMYDETFKLKKTIKVSRDVISDMRVYEGGLLAVTAYDGTIALVDLQNDVVRSTQVDGQLFEICRHEEDFYVSGSKSYKMDGKLKNCEEIERTNYFISFKKELFGINHTRGLFNYTQSFSTYSPCDMIKGINDHIIGVFAEGITIFTLSQNGISWKSQKVPQFIPGYPCRAIVALNDKQFILGGDSGHLYKFTLHK